jgi:hypothetical protein
MKIFRAIVHYNNGDINEWEEWFDVHSKWYASRELAEKHLPMLNKLADAMRYQNRNNCFFEANDPLIEEHEIAETFIPIDFKEWQYIAFEEFSYIPYEGPHSISSQELNLSGFPNPSWNIIVGIGELYFDLRFTNYRREGKEQYNISPCSSKESKYYMYRPEEREVLLSLCEEYAESILHYYKEYNKASSLDDWDDAREAENTVIATLLRNSHVKLSEASVKEIKRELEHWRSSEHPRYKKSLEELLKFTDK